MRLGAYAALTLVLTFPLALHPASTLPASGDAWQFYWNLWWLKRAILDWHVNPYVCPAVHHPYGADLHFHTLNLLPGVLALPIAVIWNLAVAYSVIAWTGFVLAGLLADGLARDLLLEGERRPPTPAERWAALVAGCAFAFSTYHFMHLLGHLDMVATFWLPWFALLLLRALRDGRGPILLAAAVLAGTSLTSWYYALDELVLTAVVVAHRVVTDRASRRRLIARAAAVVALGLLLVSPLLTRMLVLGRTLGRVPDPWGDMVRFSADLVGFVTPPFLHPVWGGWFRPFHDRLARNGNIVESAVYLGLVALVLALYGRLRSGSGRSAPSSNLWWLVLAVFGCLALGPVLHVGGRTVAVAGHDVWLPYALVARLPYADIPRSLARFSVGATLAVSMLAAFGARRLLDGVSSARRPVVGFTLAALILVDNLAVPFPTSAIRVPAAYHWLAAQPVPTKLTHSQAPLALLEVPIPDDPFRHPQRMLYQTVHERPVFGGYLSRGLPPLPFAAVPGFAQFASLSPTIDDVVAYEPASLGPLSLAALDSYGAAFVAIDKPLLGEEGLARARRVWASLAGNDNPAFEDRETLVYSVPRGVRSPVAAVWLDRGWSYLERTTGIDALRWRWMGDESALRVSVPRAGTYALQLEAHAFGRPRRLSMEIGGANVGTIEIGMARASVPTPPFTLAPGIHSMGLKSRDGTDLAGHGDPRRLSIALYKLSLVAVD